MHQWRSALTYLAAEELPKNEALWPEFELFCALIDRVNLSDELIAVLQETVAKNTCRLSAARLSIYNLLMYMHRSPRAKTIAKDLDLRKDFPVEWLDLFVATNADLSYSQSVFLEAIKQHNYSAKMLAARLQMVRTLGGTSVGSWIQRIIDSLPTKERPAFREICRSSGLEVSAPKAPEGVHLRDSAAWRYHSANMRSVKQPKPKRSEKVLSGAAAE